MEREGDGLRSVSLSDQVLEHYGRGERVKKRGAKASLRRLLFPGCGRRSSEQTETDETLFRQCGKIAIDETWFDETTTPGTRARWGKGAC